MGGVIWTTCSHVTSLSPRSPTMNAAVDCAVLGRQDGAGWVWPVLYCRHLVNPMWLESSRVIQVSSSSSSASASASPSPSPSSSSSTTTSTSMSTSTIFFSSRYMFQMWTRYKLLTPWVFYCHYLFHVPWSSKSMAGMATIPSHWMDPQMC